MKALVVDDEKPAREELVWLLGQCEDIEVSGQAHSAEAALAALSEAATDVVFLDIDMPGIGGMRLAEKLREDAGDGPAVVFVTAYDNHAVEAFGGGDGQGSQAAGLDLVLDFVVARHPGRGGRL